MRRCKVKLVEDARRKAKTGRTDARYGQATTRSPPLGRVRENEPSTHVSPAGSYAYVTSRSDTFGAQPAAALCRARVPELFGTSICRSHQISSGLCAVHLQEYRELRTRHQQALDKSCRLQHIISRMQTMVAFRGYDKASDVLQAIQEVQKYLAAFDEAERLATKLDLYQLPGPSTRPSANWHNVALGLLPRLRYIHDDLVECAARARDNVRHDSSRPGSGLPHKPQTDGDGNRWGVAIGLIATGAAAMLGCGVVGSLAIGGVICGLVNAIEA
ncbi:hypothetical protein C8Q79DRAFT_312545 [Trametes meyenii]|nr:hypothetical protein C8Q79DRAFT_312545 [Trametes meyenii]